MSVDLSQLARVPGTRLFLSRVGFGSAAIGGLFEPVTEHCAQETIERAWELGVRYYDTAPFYGFGRSEEHLGRVLAAKPRDAFVLSTKVGRLLERGRSGARGDTDVFAGSFDRVAVFDFSRDGVRRSIDESLKRLRLDRIEIALLHDPENHWGKAISEAYPALHELRAEGAIGAIGVGMIDARMLTRFVRAADLDLVLCAGRYTLLDQTALNELLPACIDRGVGVVIGGVFNSGLLVDPRAGARFDYAPAPAEWVSQALRLKGVCQRHGVSLQAAAVQFPFAHPAVLSVLAGARSAAEMDGFVRLLGTPVPEALWQELRADGLLASTAPVPGSLDARN